MDAVSDARVDVALAVAVDSVRETGGDEGEEFAGGPSAVFFDGVAVARILSAGWHS